VVSSSSAMRVFISSPYRALAAPKWRCRLLIYEPGKPWALLSHSPRHIRRTHAEFTGVLVDHRERGAYLARLDEEGTRGRGQHLFSSGQR
jgi:hypothetical protein